MLDIHIVTRHYQWPFLHTISLSLSLVSLRPSLTATETRLVSSTFLAISCGSMFIKLPPPFHKGLSNVAEIWKGLFRTYYRKAN